jgi:ABC-type phosphate/phosphonate transport system ATPase subunit
MVFQQFNLSGRLDVLTNVLVGRLAHVPIHRALMGLKEQFRHHHGERPWPGTAAAVP